MQVVYKDDQCHMSKKVYDKVLQMYTLKGLIVTNDQHQTPLAVFTNRRSLKSQLRGGYPPNSLELHKAGSEGVEVAHGILRARIFTPSDFGPGETIEQKKSKLEKEQGKIFTALVESALRIAENNRLIALAAHNTSVSPGSFIITSPTRFDGSEQSDDGEEFSRIFDCSITVFVKNYCTSAGKLFHFPFRGALGKGTFDHCPAGCTPTGGLWVHIGNCFRNEQTIPSSTSRGKTYPTFTGRFLDIDKANRARAQSTAIEKKKAATKSEKKQY
jgi:hypothetical protein